MCAEEVLYYVADCGPLIELEQVWRRRTEDGNDL